MRKPDAPQDLATQAATIRTKLGQHERAIDNLREMIMTTDNERARKKMLRRLALLADDRTADMRSVARQQWRRRLEKQGIQVNEPETMEHPARDDESL